MSGITATKREHNGTIDLDAEVVEAFATSLRGRCLTAADEGYDDARVIWNGLADKRPALIAQCAGTADVIDAVNFAREHDLLVAVRGGGHNVAGNAVCDGGIVIDLSLMNGVRVDLAARTVRAGGGASKGTRPFWHLGQSSTAGRRLLRIRLRTVLPRFIRESPPSGPQVRRPGFPIFLAYRLRPMREQNG